MPEWFGGCISLALITVAACGYPPLAATNGNNIDSGAGSDTSTASIDAAVCFGTAPFTICLAAAPTAPLVLSTATPFDTDLDACVGTTSGGTGYCVLAATTISFEGERAWRATGSRPVVLIASDSITVSAGLDVGSHRIVPPATGPDAGAGADPVSCPAPLTVPSNGGGGAGGSFTGVGGPGAASARGGSSGGAAGAAAMAAGLRGGCPGQDGEGTGTDRGMGGHGGGAVLLIAVNTINITAAITAGGQGGRSGAQNTSGGGGGGAGGMIVLDARTVTSTGFLTANGGGGGEGSGENVAGTAGSDAIGVAAATGGTSIPNGGDGGNGSAVAAAGAGAPGSVGTTVSNIRGGGGGGGGGAGLIKAPLGAVLGTQISPVVTP